MRASELFGRMNITVDIKLNLLTTCVFSVLLYDADTWTIKKKMAFEMRCYRNLLNIRKSPLQWRSIRQCWTNKRPPFGQICRMPDNIGY